ncbi:hypothetical protein J6590_001939 [Homalodisca vitripennis]|nr:hypothetical protein J6590_001939 [Homalodisca vitripennis]
MRDVMAKKPSLALNLMTSGSNVTSELSLKAEQAGCLGKLFGFHTFKEQPRSTLLDSVIMLYHRTAQYPLHNAIGNRCRKTSCYVLRESDSSL